jgi:hypothetical protein
VYVHVLYQTTTLDVVVVPSSRPTPCVEQPGDSGMKVNSFDLASKVTTLLTSLLNGPESCLCLFLESQRVTYGDVDSQRIFQSCLFASEARPHGRFTSHAPSSPIFPRPLLLLQPVTRRRFTPLAPRQASDKRESSSRPPSRRQPQRPSSQRACFRNTVPHAFLPSRSTPKLPQLQQHPGCH